MKRLLLLFVCTTVAFGQGGRPPIDKYSQLRDVDVTGLAINNVMIWNGTVWVPSSSSGSSSLPPIAGQGGKFLTTDATTIFWGLVPFASLSGKPTTAAGYGIVGGANLDTWGTKTPYAGSLTIASGKTVSFPNTFSITATDGAALNIGAGGTLGTNAFNSTAFALQSTTVNGHALSSNVTVTKTDLGLGYLLSGAGSPEGAIAAPVGSQYARTDGGVGTSFYVKQTGSGNIGWAAGAGGGSLPTGGIAGQVLVKNSANDFDASFATDPGGAGGGSGTVTSVSVVTANGVSATCATCATTPALTFSLGAITPTSVASTGTVTGTNISGTNTGDQTITLTGPVTGTGTGSFGTAISDNAVGLTKIATIPASTILGNNTAGITNPIALTPSQVKTVLSLNNVENTALSTWAGSTNLTTVGNLTGSPPNSSVAFSLLPVGTSSTTVAIGNDGRFPASVTGIRKSSGAGSTDVAATVNIDYTKAGEGLFGDVGDATSPQTWGAGKTVMSESATLNASRFAILPVANTFAPGTIITYIDNKSTRNFGRNFRPVASGPPADTLNGFTNAQYVSGVPPNLPVDSWLQPFIAGGLTPGQGVYQFKTDGVNAWVSIYADGRATKAQDPVDASKYVTFDVSNQPTTGTHYITSFSNQGDSSTVSQLDPDNITHQVVNSFNHLTGTLGTVQLRPADLAVTQDNIVPATIISNAHPVAPDNGSVDTVKLSNFGSTPAISAPLTIQWVSASNYSSGESVTFFDSSGTINAQNTVTITANTGSGAGDVFNGDPSVTLKDPYSVLTLRSDGTSNWSFSRGISTSPILNVGPFSPPLTDAAIINKACDQTVFEQHWQLTSTTAVGTTRTIRITNARDGEHGYIRFIHNSTGGDTFLIQGSGTPSGGNGTLYLSSVANAIDEVEWRQIGTSISARPVALNVTGGGAIACTNPGTASGTASTTAFVAFSSSSATKFRAVRFTALTAAHSDSFCTTQSPIFKSGTVPDDTQITEYIYTDSGSGPGTVVAQSTAIAASSVTATTVALANSTPTSFTYPSTVSLSNGTNYYRVYGVSAVGTSLNHFSIVTNVTGTATVSTSTNGTTWTAPVSGTPWNYTPFF